MQAFLEYMYMYNAEGRGGVITDVFLHRVIYIPIFDAVFYKNC